MLEGLRHALRFFKVARTLARHDAVFWIDDLGPAPAWFKASTKLATRFVRQRKGLSDSPGKRFAAALHSLGPAYIKLGQMLATRPDIMGDEVADGLRDLQDKLPPFPADEARLRVEDELEKPLNAIFSDFSENPIAAASIAQVHKAVTLDGRSVAVKVLRPGINALFERDLAAFAWVARFAERSIPRAKRLRPVAVVETIIESVATELDLRLEAAAASELAENMMGEPGYRVPEIDWERTSKRVMTLEWVDGISLAKVDKLKEAGFDCRQLASIIVRAFLLQAMRDGFFHADLHQGNLLVEPDGTITALDFGIMGRLDRASRRYLAEILYGFLQKDYERVARWHFSAGYVPKDRSVARFAQAMRAVAEPIFGRPVRAVSAGKLLGQLFATTEAFGMETQPQLILLQRTMVMVEGIALHLDPQANMWELSRPVIESWMREQLSPEVALADHINETLDSFKKLPVLVHRAHNVLERLDQSSLDAHKDKRHENTMVVMMILIAMTGAFFGLAALVLAVIR